MPSSTFEALFIALQRALPARLLGRLVYSLARSRAPVVKNLLIRGFVRIFDVDTSEAAAPVPGGYANFNEFFTRGLRDGARPVDADTRSVLSPADGTIQQIGVLDGGTMLQAKGIVYSAGDLLGDEPAAARYRDGSFVTVYLAPWNYHRFHMPASARITRLTHVPGELWSVNATTAARIPRLFARNERLVCHCLSEHGEFAMVLVGALNVGSISLSWCGEVLPRASRSISSWDYPPDHAGTRLLRGEVLGQFNMGSTVIVLFPPGAVRWQPGLAAGHTLRACSPIGWLQQPAGAR